jgi:hypothetical protein
VLPSLVTKIEYCRTLHRGSKEPSRPGSLSRLPATDHAPSSRFPATKKPSVSSFASAFLPGLPRAFFAKGSVCQGAFLPGSGLRVESDVTRSKPTAATFLPGSRIACCHARTSLANALSNRELHLLEPTLTHRKQTIAPRPNRELSTNPYFRNSVLRSVRTSLSFTLTKEGPLAPSHCSVLTGSGLRTELSVTRSKQTTATFLTGSRIARLAILHARFLTFENLTSHRRPIQIFLRPTT